MTTSCAPGIARWFGSQFSTVGGGVTGAPYYNHVRAMAAWDDDGPGPHSLSLFAGGRFLQAGGQTVNSIARWDGASWSPLGQGFVGETFPDKVCTTASNGREALDKLIRNEFQPDLIFLDLNMPLMSGKQFLEELKNYEELMKIPVVILSTSSDSKSIMETKALGAKHFITKPDKFTVLEIKLKEFFTNPSL